MLCTVDKFKYGLAVLQLCIICVLWMCELVLSVVSHSLTLRLTMCHSLVVVMSSLAYYWHYHKSAKSIWRSERFLSLWLVICFVAMVALCLVNFIHAVQMMTHRHDVGVHNPFWLLGLASFGLVFKLLYLPFGPELYSSTVRSRVCCCVFYMASSLCVFTIAVLIVSGHAEQLILWLDPALTALASLLLAASVYDPLVENMMILLLAVPSELDLQEIIDDFHTKFSNINSHNLHIWRESRSQISLSMHVKVDHGSDQDPKQMPTFDSKDMVQFLKSKGIHKIMIQPEYTELTSSSNECLLQCKHCDTGNLIHRVVTLG